MMCGTRTPAMSGPSVIRLIRLGFLPTAEEIDAKNGFLYVVGVDSPLLLHVRIGVLSLRTGLLIRTIALPNQARGPALLRIADRSNRVLAIAGSDFGGPVVAAVNASSGKLMHISRIGPQASVLPGVPYDESGISAAIDDSLSRILIFFTVTSGAASTAIAEILDLRDGRVVHTASMAGNNAPVAEYVDESRHRLLALNAGRYAVVEFDTGSGKLLWTSEKLQGGGTCGVVSGGKGAPLLVVNQAPPSSVSFFDGRSGRVLRTIPLGARISMLPPCSVAVDETINRAFIVAQGQIINGVAQQRGNLVVLDARRGRVARIVPVGFAPLSVAFRQSDRHVFVANAGDSRRLSDGSVSVLDGVSGQALRTITLPGNPNTVVVDQKKGTAFVCLSTGTATGSVAEL